VLSERAFNDRTAVVIGLPMTTAVYNVDNPFAVPVGPIRRADKTKISYVLCHQPKSFDWRARRGRPHAPKMLSDAIFASVCIILNQIMRLA
jgi:mRNA interferase MazF